MEVIGMKFRLFDWTDIVDEDGEKWEKYAVVKEWTITDTTPAEEILAMVEAVKDDNVDILTDDDSVDWERNHWTKMAEFDHLVEVLKEAGWRFLDEPHYDWYNESAIVFNSKFGVVAEYDNFDTYIKQEMEKFKEISKRWDYI